MKNLIELVAIGLAFDVLILIYCIGIGIELKNHRKEMED